MSYLDDLLKEGDTLTDTSNKIREEEKATESRYTYDDSTAWERFKTSFASGFQGSVEQLNIFSKKKTGEDKWYKNFDEIQDYKDAWQGFKYVAPTIGNDIYNFGGGEGNLFDENISTTKLARDSLTGELTFGSSVIKAAETPFVAGFSALAGGGIQDSEGKMAKFGEYISTAEKWLGDNLDNKYINLDDDEKAQLGQTLLEGAMIGGGEAAFKGIGKGASGVYSGAKKVAKKLVTKEKTPTQINEEIFKKTLEFKKEANLFDGEKDVSGLVSTLEELTNNIKKGEAGTSDVKYVADKFKLTDMSFFEDMVADATKKTTVSKKVEGNLMDGFYNKVSAKKIDDTLKKLDEIKYNGSLKTKNLKAAAKKIGGDPNTIKEALEVKKAYEASVYDPDKALKELYDYQQLKKTDFEDVKGTVDFDRKGELLKGLYDNGYIKVAKNTDYLHSFQLTEKGIKHIDSSMLPDAAKNDLKNIGVAELPKHLWDNVVGNDIKNADKIAKQLSLGTEPRELGKLYLEKVKGNTSKTLDGDIIYTMYKIDEKYGLNMKKQIDDIYDPVTGGIHLSRLEKAVNDIKSTDNLLKFKKIKTKKTDFKNLKDKLGYDEKVNKALFDEGKRLTEIEYKAKLKDAEINFSKLKRKIVKIAKKDKNKARGLLVEATERFKAEKMAINAKAGKIDAVRNLLVEQLEAIVRDKSFKGNGYKVFFKNLVKKSGIRNAKTQKELNKAINQAYKSITEEYANGLVNKITEELNVKKFGKSTPKSKRTKVSFQEYKQLLEAKELFSHIKTGDLSIPELEKLLKEIKITKSEGVKKAKIEQHKLDVEINNDIAQIKKEGIQDLDGQKNIIDRSEASLFEKAKKGVISIYNETTFIPRLFSKIFGKDGVAYKHFIDNVNIAYNKFDLFYNNKTVGVMNSLHDLFGDDIKDFGQLVFTLNKKIDEKGVKYEGFNRIIEDKLSAAHKPRTTKPKFDTVPDDFPLRQHHWDKIKDTKLGEILEKYNDPKYKKGLMLWDSYNLLVGKKINEIVEKTEGYPLNFRDHYMTFKRLNGGDESIDIDFGGKKMLEDKITDGFLKETSEHVKGYNYEYNPINILASSGRQQVYYIHMKPQFDINRRLLRGKSIEINEANIETLEEKLSTGHYKLINSLGDEVEFVGVDKKAGNVVTKEGAVPMDTVSLQSKAGIKSELTPEARKYINEYMDTIAKGGHYTETTTDRYVAKIAGHANVMPLVGNISVILKQGLSLFDAMGVAGVKPMLGAMKDLHSNPSLFIRLSEQVDAIASRGGGDFLLKEIKPGTTKLGKAYSKYIEFGTAGMKITDQYIYSQIWYGAYKDFLVKNKLATKNAIITDFTNAKAIKKANDIANRAASTANPLWMPSAYKNIYVKQFFGIATTQLNRVDEMLNEFPRDIREGNYGSAARRATFFFASNAAELAITHAVGQFLYDIGASTYEGYNAEFIESMTSLDGIYRMTLGQMFAFNKMQSVMGFGITGLSPTLSFAAKVARDLKAMYDKEGLEPANAIKLIGDIWGGKFVDQIIKISNN